VVEEVLLELVEDHVEIRSELRGPRGDCLRDGPVGGFEPRARLRPCDLFLDGCDQAFGRIAAPRRKEDDRCAVLGPERVGDPRP
jgi:hypothetical protein